MSICRTYACCWKGCQAVIHLHHDTEQKLRKSHEDFYCPAGHAQAFVGATKEEEKIAQLERSVDRWQELWGEMADSRDEWKLAVKQCPFECGFRVVRKSKLENVRFALANHLIEEHGAAALYALDLTRSKA